MFDLIESCPERREGLGWTGRIVSALIHMFLLSAAIAATRGVVEAVGAPPLTPTDVFWPRPDQPPAPPVGGTGSPSWTVSAPVIIPTTIPEPGEIIVDVPSSGDPAPWTPGFDPLPGPTPGPIPSPGGSLPLDVRLVDEQPELLMHPALRYPDVLRRAGIEGRVLVETVLDTLGRSEAGAARVVSSPHPLFDREALSVVTGSRYRPGRIAGRAVRVRVRVPISFEIRR